MFLVDARQGVTPQDRNIAELLRRSGRPIVLAANKAEGLPPERAASEFYELGLGRAAPDVVRARRQRRPKWPSGRSRSRRRPADAIRTHPAADAGAVKVAIIGRPNVGKSTLVNSLLGEERVIAFDQPGTTRDSIYLDFERNGRQYVLIDTAGVRRRGKVLEAVEKFSVIKTMQAIEDANVVVLLFDAEQGITEQDAHLAGYILEAGRALVVAVNKWDAVPPRAAATTSSASSTGRPRFSRSPATTTSRRGRAAACRAFCARSMAPTPPRWRSCRRRSSPGRSRRP